MAALTRTELETKESPDQPAAAEEEKDSYELMLERSGCLQQHHTLQDCFFDRGKDWRKCAAEMKDFKECMDKQKRQSKSTAHQT